MRDDQQNSRDHAARQMLAEAIACWKTEPERATDLIEEAFVLAENLGDPSLKADVLLQRGIQYADARKHDRAEYDGRAALTIYQQLGMDLSVAQAMKVIATAYCYRSQYAESTSFCRQALQIAQRLQQRELIVDLLLRLGWDCHSQSEYQKALEYFRDALNTSIELQDDERIAQSTADIAVVYTRTNRINEAVEYLNKALKYYSQSNHARGRLRCLSDLAMLHAKMNDQTTALELNYQALDIANSISLAYSQAVLYTNIAVVYYNMHDLIKSIENLKKALLAHERNNDALGCATCLSNLVVIYTELHEYDVAVEYATRALELSLQLHSKELEALNYVNLSTIFSTQQDYEKALSYAQKSIDMHTDIGYKVGIGTSYANKGAVLLQLQRFEDALQSFMLALPPLTEFDHKDGLTKVYLSLSELFSHPQAPMYNQTEAESWLLKAEQIGLSTTSASSEVSLKLAEMFERKEEHALALQHFRKYMALEKENQNDVAKKQAQQLHFERYKADRDKQLAVERARAQATDDILANILPSSIVERLLRGEKKIADAYEKVSVLFVDIVDFTKLSARISAAELIDMLDTVFTRFDAICNKHGLEKIKTIGDAYMAVCGAPIHHPNHAARTAYAALDMLDDFAQLHLPSLPDSLNVRIGLHTGPVVAGIIGENKYSYDLWGDAVNTAARMESHGVAGKIQTSEEFRHALSADLDSMDHDVQLFERGEIEIKGKGLMKTYFLQRNH